MSLELAKPTPSPEVIPQWLKRSQDILRGELHLSRQGTSSFKSHYLRSGTYLALGSCFSRLYPGRPFAGDGDTLTRSASFSELLNKIVSTS